MRPLFRWAMRMLKRRFFLFLKNIYILDLVCIRRFGVESKTSSWSGLKQPSLLFVDIDNKFLIHFRDYCHDRFYALEQRYPVQDTALWDPLVGIFFFRHTRPWDATIVDLLLVTCSESTKKLLFSTRFGCRSTTMFRRVQRTQAVKEDTSMNSFPLGFIHYCHPPYLSPERWRLLDCCSHCTVSI